MKHIIVKGIVQNVFFRDNTKKKAKEFGMKGSVKNLEDGSVEIFVKENKNLNVFIEWCKKGP